MLDNRLEPRAAWSQTRGSRSKAEYRASDRSGKGAATCCRCKTKIVSPVIVEVDRDLLCFGCVRESLDAPFSQLLRSLRTLVGWTVHELADRVGISVAILAQLERSTVQSAVKYQHVIGYLLRRLYRLSKKGRRPDGAASRKERRSLVDGPYRPPTLRLFRDGLVVVTSWTGARIPWPRCRLLNTHGGGSGLLVDEELLRVIRTESATALKWWWGVSTHTVWSWRKAHRPNITEGRILPSSRIRQLFGSTSTRMLPRMEALVRSTMLSVWKPSALNV